MPSTNPLPSLSISFRRAEMTAFWILTTGVASVALGLGSVALGARAPWAWGAAGLWLLLPGVVWPQWFEIGIRAWNKGVRLSAAVLRIYVLRVCYYLLFGAMSRTGSSLDFVLGNPAVSRWIPRARRDPVFGDLSSLAVGDGWWGHELLALVRSPAKAWMVCLLPMLLLLMVLRDEAQGSAPPSSTYTLY